MDLTTKDDVKKLMLSSTSEQEWNDKCEKVKSANGGKYPEFWFRTIVSSGVSTAVRSNWE